MQIGPYKIKNPLVLSPMAGITDHPFRALCRQLGAGLAVSEMVSANPKLWQTQKSLRRINHQNETGPRIVQIAGSDPKAMALAAQYNVDQGAQIIDINMGCPAKKVCNVMAGSALMGKEKLAEQILQSVVKAVNVPVTLKMRTGLHKNAKNALQLATIAQDNGIRSIALHGRTREDQYKGAAEYDTIARVKQAISIPIFANGDITSAEKAKYVLEYTKADGVYIGRAAQGNPWIFREINHYLKTNTRLSRPTMTEFRSVVLEHLDNIYQFYGEYLGVRIARKHINWYLQSSGIDGHKDFRRTINKIESSAQQYELISNYFIKNITHESNFMVQGNKAA